MYLILGDKCVHRSNKTSTWDIWVMYSFVKKKKISYEDLYNSVRVVFKG